MNLNKYKFIPLLIFFNPSVYYILDSKYCINDGISFPIINGMMSAIALE